MPDCPEDTELAGFLNDSLPGDRLAHVSGHVDGCPQCQARLDRLTEQTSGAVARYKELSSNVLPDARSGGGGAPEADTQILGGRAAQVVAKLVGLPQVPGFEVVAEIGRGGMGVVYKARHRRLNRLVALKMILAGTAADPRVVQRFLFEAEVLARIQHPQVVQVFEVDTYQGPSGVPIPYLAMELLEGGSLSRKLRENAGQAGTAPRWPTARGAAELVEGLARAVHAAHLRGVIHRDLKPGNILFPSKHEIPNLKSETKQGSSGSLSDFEFRASNFAPKVMDFGLAKFTRDAGADLTQSGQVIGTPQYMAPEQAAGSKDISPAADTYALGAILFECLAGRPPFTGSEPMSVLLKVVNEAPPDVRSLRPDIPRNLAAVTMKCLEKDPGRRYASAEALANDLRRFLEDRPTRARPVTNLERARLWAKRNPVVTSLTAALAVVLFAAFGTVAALWMKAEDKAEAEKFAKSRSEIAEAKARSEMEKTEVALQEMKRQQMLAELRQARLEFAQAVVSSEEGRVQEGLGLFLRAAATAEVAGDADLARVARVNIAAWPRELPPTPRALPHKEQPRLATFHPDGKHLVAAGRAGEIHLWDLTTKQRVRTYKPVPQFFTTVWEAYTYWTVAISPDGKTIAAGDSDGSITLWDIDNPKHRLSFKAVPRNESVWSIGFASNDILWVNDGLHGLNRWDLSVKAPKATQLSPKKPFSDDVVQILVVSPDGKRVFTGDRGATVREWDTTKNEEVRSWRVEGWITDIALSHDGKRLAATGSGGAVWLIDLTNGRIAMELPLAGAYGNGVAFAPKSPVLIASDGDGNVRFWHRETGQPIGIPMRFHGEVTRPRFRLDSDEFAIPAGDAVCLAGVPAPPGDLISAGYGWRLRGLDYSPKGDRLAVVDDDTNFDVFDPLTRKQYQHLYRRGRAPLCLHFEQEPSRSRVFFGIREGIEWLEVPNGKKVNPLIATKWLQRVHRIDSLPGNGGVYVMGQTLVARLHPVTFEQLKVAKPAKDIPAGVTLNAMTLHPDGREVLVSFADRVIFLKGDALEPLREWKVGDELLDARYTPDGTKVLIGRRDNVAELLDAATGKPVVLSMPHARAVAAVAVSPDGKVLLTGSRDGTARFWDAATGLPLGSPMRHAGPVTYVAFSPKGDHIATGTGAGHVMIWDLPPAPAKGTIGELGAKLQK
jgi:serine/threonine protein kinase/WD40 repeat protein